MTASKNDIHSCLVPVGLLATRWVFLKLFLETKNKSAADWKCDIMEIIIINGNNHQLGYQLPMDPNENPLRNHHQPTKPARTRLKSHSSPIIQSGCFTIITQPNSHTLRHPVTMPKTSVTSTTVAHPHLRLPQRQPLGMSAWFPGCRPHVPPVNAIVTYNGGSGEFAGGRRRCSESPQRRTIAAQKSRRW